MTPAYSTLQELLATLDALRSEFDATQTYLVLDALEKHAATLKKAISGEVLDELGDDGVLEVSGGKVQRITRVERKPIEKNVRRALHDHGLSESDAFDVVRKWVMNPSRVKNLVAQGKLPPELIEPRETAYLKATPPKRELLEDTDE